jgi:hypothetical protein
MDAQINMIFAAHFTGKCSVEEWRDWTEKTLNLGNFPTLDSQIFCRNPVIGLRNFMCRNPLVECQIRNWLFTEE